MRQLRHCTPTASGRPLAYCGPTGVCDVTTPTLDHGFRIRGASPTRVDAFVDAAFAFAVTLLVISIGHVPQSIADLVQALRGVPAFAASFYIISRFWQSHRSWSRHYGIEDAYGVRLSLALVFLMLVYVYPLRMVAELTLASFSGGALEETPIVVHSVTDLRTIYVVFGIGYALTAAIFVLLHRHALDLADASRADDGRAHPHAHDLPALDRRDRTGVSFGRARARAADGPRRCVSVRCRARDSCISCSFR